MVTLYLKPIYCIHPPKGSLGTQRIIIEH